MINRTCVEYEDHFQLYLYHIILCIIYWIHIIAMHFKKGEIEYDKISLKNSCKSNLIIIVSRPDNLYY